MNNPRQILEHLLVGRHLSEAQARAFMIADNRLTEISVWDDRLLAEQLKELSALELDFSLETTGFEMGEIDLRIENLNSELQAKEDAAGAGAPAPGMPTPSVCWAKRYTHTAGASRREDAEVYRSVIARSTCDEAIHLSPR